LLNSLDTFPTKRHQLECFLINCTGEDKNSLLSPVMQKSEMQRDLPCKPDTGAGERQPPWWNTYPPAR